jgi:hypothetical protein
VPTVVPLFDVDAARTDGSPKGHLEGTFEFHDRASTQFWAEVRRVINEWFAHYPAGAREDLRRDLTSSSDRASEAAMWELMLHELYFRAGFDLEVHPELPGSSRRPDFLVSRGHEAFLLEARVVNDESDEDRLRERRRRAIYELIDRVRPDAFYVRLEILRDGEQQPRVRTLEARLQGWLESLDPDVVEADLVGAQDFRAAPTFEFESRGWHLRFYAIAARAERRGRLSGGVLGILPGGTFVGDPARAVRSALREKGSRYGDTPLPLVLAFAIEGLLIKQDHVESALFGTTVAELDSRDPTVVISEYRKDDGYFAPQRGRRVAGVVTVPTPRPMFAPQLTPHLWLNPWAERPFAAERLWAWTTVSPNDRTLEHGAATVTPAQLLGLAEPWPPGEPFRNS